MAKKTYVLDTNVPLTHPDSLYAFENNDNIQEFLRSFCSNSKTTFKIPTNEVFTKQADGTCDVSFNLEVSHKDVGATLESHKDLLGENKLLQIPA